MKGLDSYITGNYGEDQFVSYCEVCGKRYDAENRASELGYAELPNTCSTACDRVAEIYRLEKMGAINRGCSACKEFYDSPNPGNVFAPYHTAMPSCESGKLNHCTCDTCF